MTARPNSIGSPTTLAALFTESPAIAARKGLRWLGTEVLWTADILTRLTVSVLVLRAVSRLTAQWFFPREIWNQSDQILKGFAGEEDAGTNAINFSDEHLLQGGEEAEVVSPAGDMRIEDALSMPFVVASVVQLQSRTHQINNKVEVVLSCFANCEHRSS